MAVQFQRLRMQWHKTRRGCAHEAQRLNMIVGLQCRRLPGDHRARWPRRHVWRHMWRRDRLASRNSNAERGHCTTEHTKRQGCSIRRQRTQSVSMMHWRGCCKRAAGAELKTLWLTVQQGINVARAMYDIHQCHRVGRGRRWPCTADQEVQHLLPMRGFLS